MLLNMYQVKEIKREIKKYLETSENLWNVPRRVSKGKVYDDKSLRQKRTKISDNLPYISRTN